MTLRRRPIEPAGGHVRGFLAASDATFMVNWFDELLFPSTTAAAWPACRRAVWAAECRGRVPLAASVFDGITGPSDGLWRVAAIDQAHGSVDAFEQRDPHGARIIADYLTAYRESLDALSQGHDGGRAVPEGAAGAWTYGGAASAPEW